MKKLLHSLLPFFGLFLFAAALWALHQALREYHYHDIVRSIREIRASRLWGALLLTALDYVVMTGYDSLAFRYIRRSLPYRKIALASFIGYAFSNNVGLAMIAGSSVRFRLYSAWGMSGLEIARVVAFYTVTLWLGLFAVSGAVFLLEPTAVPALLDMPFATVRPPGSFSLSSCADILPGPFSPRGLFHSGDGRSRSRPSAFRWPRLRSLLWIGHWRGACSISSCPPPCRCRIRDFSAYFSWPRRQGS